MKINLQELKGIYYGLADIGSIDHIFNSQINHKKSHHIMKTIVKYLDVDIRCLIFHHHLNIIDSIDQRRRCKNL